MVEEATLWQGCLLDLQEELSQQQFNTWIRPLQAECKEDGLYLFAPNKFVLDWIGEKFLQRIKEIAEKNAGENLPIFLSIGSKGDGGKGASPRAFSSPNLPNAPLPRVEATPEIVFQSNLNPLFTFENYVEGKSNQLARAAAVQVAENPGKAYNPLFVYGGVGLGKTHLLHAIGNLILKNKKGARVLYLHSERFVADMVKALQTNRMNDFKVFLQNGGCYLDR